MKLISFETIERFSVLGQFGYGMLRFSIGSYPNEYGIVASFVSAVLLLSLSQKWKALPFSRTTTIIFLGLTYIALLLTTTRSAYVACFLSICYIFWFRKKVLLWASLFSLSVLGILKLFNISIIQFILFGFDWMQVTQGSMGSRVILWSQTWEEFSSQALWGKGFAAFADLHNVYFQLLGELGLVGICLLIGALTCAFFKRRVLLFFPKEELTPEELFAKCVRRVGMMHVLWFALTNHNLNHHLTWLIFLFYFASWISAKQATCKPLRFISEDWY
ncbi:MAG: O-antigen ligase family protein [Rhabdochlamydiaceae bacterium]